MTWFRLDDQFHSHPKVIAAGNAAIGLYCRLGTYCADKLTDGFVPESVARSMGSLREIRALCASPIPGIGPLLIPVEAGYRMPDYLDYNPTREAVLTERRKAKGRMDRLRGRSPDVRPNEHPNNGANLARSSSSPVPVPHEQVSDTSTPVDTPPDGGLPVDIRIGEVADHYARMAVERANGTVDHPDAYRRRARSTALEHPDLARYLNRWPTAPADAVAAWLHGDKHSMSYFPDTADDGPTATVHHLRPGDTA